MLIDTNEVLLDYVNKPILQGPEQVLTVRDAIYVVLNNPAPDDIPTPQAKADAFRITTAVFADATYDVSVADSAFILQCSGKVASALLHGRLTELLEGRRLSAIEDSVADAG